MAENRVTQIPVEYSGTPSTTKALVTQLPLEYSGSPAVTKALVTQLAIEYSSLVAVFVTQSSTFTNTNSFPAGGSVALVTGIPVDQTTTYTNPNSFPAGGSLDNTIPLTGTATVPTTAAVITGGVLQNPLKVIGTAAVPTSAAVITGGVMVGGLPITGTALIPSTALVNGGGRADVGLYIPTMAPASLLGFMDLGTIWLGQVMPLGLSPIDIEGAFSYVPVSTALVVTGGTVGAGVFITGGTTVPSTASVALGGAVGGLPLVGGATAGAGQSVPTPGDVQIQTGITILGGFVVPSTAAVTTNGVILFGGFIRGTATVPSTASVIAGGVITGGGQVLAYTPEAFTWSGHGVKAMPVRQVNMHDIELLNEREAMQALMRSVEHRSVQTQIVSQGGLGSLGGRKTFRDYCAPVDHVNCHKVNLRKNLFEKGKLLTPADGGVADHTVLEFWVPTGYHCSLLAFYNVYTGTGFVQGSGDIIWRVRVGNAWARNFGNSLFALGNAAGTVPLGTAIELVGNDRVQFQVNVPNVSGNIQVGASYILCGVQGWLYPEGSWAQLEGR